MGPKLVALTILERDLPSGRSLRITADEVIEITRDGGLEVRIALTAAGPVIDVAAGALRLEGTELKVDCDELTLHSKTATTLSSDGDISLQAKGELIAEAEMIHLN